VQDAVLVLLRFPIGIVLVGSSVRGSPTWQRGEVSRGGPGRGAVVRAVGHVWGRPMLEGGDLWAVWNWWAMSVGGDCHDAVWRLWAWDLRVGESAG